MKHMSKTSFSSKWTLLLLLCIALPALLVACGDQQTATRTPTPTAAPPIAASTGTPAARVPYPWPMKQHPLQFSSGSVWLPDDARVYQEMQADFLTYWAWSGRGGPATFPFLPDAQQITRLAVSSFQAALQQYVDQLRASQQVLAYVPANPTHPLPPLQQVLHCTQDGLQCESLYSFDATTKTLYNSQSGQVLSRKTNISVVFDVSQIYDREMQQWKLSSLLFQELPA
jgi:hypothetical protein